MEIDTRLWGGSDLKAAYTLIKGLKVEAGINNVFDKNYDLEEG
jgi:outer membrane receptor protein involved in Fe transport